MKLHLAVGSHLRCQERYVVTTVSVWLALIKHAHISQLCFSILNHWCELMVLCEHTTEKSVGDSSIPECYNHTYLLQTSISFLQRPKRRGWKNLIIQYMLHVAPTLCNQQMFFHPNRMSWNPFFTRSASANID